MGRFTVIILILLIVCNSFQLRYMEDDSLIQLMKEKNISQSVIEYFAIVEEYVSFYDILSTEIFDDDNISLYIYMPETYLRTTKLIDHLSNIIKSVSNKEISTIIRNSVKYLEDLMNEFISVAKRHNEDLRDQKPYFKSATKEPNLPEYLENKNNKPIIQPSKPNVNDIIKPNKPTKEDPKIIKEDPIPIKPNKPAKEDPKIIKEEPNPIPIKPNKPAKEEPKSPSHKSYEAYTLEDMKEFYPELEINLDRLNSSDLNNIEERYKKVSFMYNLNIGHLIRVIRNYETKISSPREAEYYMPKLTKTRKDLKAYIIKTEKFIKDKLLYSLNVSQYPL